MINRIKNALSSSENQTEQRNLREAIFYNFVGGAKLQCPQCSELIEIDTFPTCQNCHAQMKVLVELTSPGYSEVLGDNTAEGKD